MLPDWDHNVQQFVCPVVVQCKLQFVSGLISTCSAITHCHGFQFIYVVLDGQLCSASKYTSDNTDYCQNQCKMLVAHLGSYGLIKLKSESVLRGCDCLGDFMCRLKDAGLTLEQLCIFASRCSVLLLNVSIRAHLINMGNTVSIVILASSSEQHCSWASCCVLLTL